MSSLPNACPVCLGSAIESQILIGHDLLFEMTDRTFSLSGCSRCHCLYMDPPLEDDELAGFYPRHYWWRPASGLLKSFEALYRSIALRDHVSFIATAASTATSHESSPPRLLDVGCGSGTLLALLKRRGFQVVGFDSSGEAAGIARAESGVEVLTASRLQDAAFADGAFDVVTMFHVLEHVSHPHDLMMEIRRILRLRGRVIVQVPNLESWQFRVFGSRWYGLDVPRHVINYSCSAMRYLLSHSGFRIRRVRHFNLRDNAPAFASSLLPNFDPLRRRAREFRTGRTEPKFLTWMKHAGYLGAVAASYPLAIAESLAGAGGTVMLEAEKA